MSEISNNSTRASKILANRRKVLKELEERKKEEKEKEKAAVENLVNRILDVFEASNKDSESWASEDLLVRKVRIELKEEKNIFCFVVFSKNSAYYGSSEVKGFGNPEDTKKLIGAMNILNAVETTKNVFNGVYDYFVNVAGYVPLQQENAITIRMGEEQKNEELEIDVAVLFEDARNNNLWKLGTLIRVPD